MHTETSHLICRPNQMAENEMQTLEYEIQYWTHVSWKVYSGSVTWTDTLRTSTLSSWQKLEQMNELFLQKFEENNCVILRLLNALISVFAISRVTLNKN